MSLERDLLAELVGRDGGQAGVGGVAWEIEDVKEGDKTSDEVAPIFGGFTLSFSC
jgi:hypothetical protein